MLGQTPTPPTPEITTVKLLTSTLASFWMSFPGAFKIMLIVMTADALSTIINPHVPFKKKIRTLALSLVLAGMVLLVYAAVQKHTELNLGFDIISGVCTFFALSSAADIIINFHAAGVPIPPMLIGLLSKAQGISGKDKAELDSINKETTQL